MFLNKMIKSGLVQQDYGYGTFPAAKRQRRYGNYSVVRPYVDSSFDTGFSGIKNSSYQPSAVKIVTPKSVNQVYKNDLTPAAIHQPIFGPTTFLDIFGKKHGEIADYVAERLKDGKYSARIGPQDASTNSILTPPTSETTTSEPTGNPPPSEVAEPIAVTETVQNSLATIPVAVGAFSSIVSNLSRYSGGPNYLSMVSHALLPQNVADYITSGHRLILDNIQTLQRSFEDAVIHPGIRVSSNLAFNTVNNLIFGQDGILGPSYTLGLSDLVMNTPISSFREILQNSQQTAIRTLTGNQAAEVTVSSFVRLWITMLAFSAMATIAPRQARQIANRFTRGNGGVLRDIPRISYQGM